MTGYRTASTLNTTDSVGIPGHSKTVLLKDSGYLAMWLLGCAAT